MAYNGQNWPLGNPFISTIYPFKTRAPVFLPFAKDVPRLFYLAGYRAADNAAHTLLLFSLNNKLVLSTLGQVDKTYPITINQFTDKSFGAGFNLVNKTTGRVIPAYASTLMNDVTPIATETPDFDQSFQDPNVSKKVKAALYDDDMISYEKTGDGLFYFLWYHWINTVSNEKRDEILAKVFA